MRPVNIDKTIAESNPLYPTVSLAESALASIGIFSYSCRQLAIDLMGDEHAARRNPVALSVLHAGLMSVVPALAAFSPADCGEDARVKGAIDFIWARGIDAYNHAIDALGEHADRHEPVAYAHLIIGYYRAMVEHMYMEISGMRRFVH